MSRDKTAGVSLLELLVTLASVAIMTSLVAPAFSSFMAQNRRSSGSQQLMNLLLTRSQAATIPSASALMASAATAKPMNIYWCLSTVTKTERSTKAN